MTREEMSALVVLEPETVREAIRHAFREAGCDRSIASRNLGCARATYHRWTVRLGMVEELEAVELRARAEGWHHGREGGWPLGRLRGPWSKTRAKRGRNRR